MSDLRTSRTRLVGAATAVLAALSLTACNDGTGTQDEGAAATKRPSSTASSTAAASNAPGTTALSDSSDSSDSSSPGATGSSASAGADSAATGSTTVTRTPAAKAPAASTTPVTCEGSNTKAVAAPLTRPVNHMLLTVTNTGSRTCFLYGYPAVRFGESQSVPPVIKDSQPQAVVTLEPGQAGYASVNLSATDGSAANSYTATSLTGYFQGRSLSGSVGKGASPALPAKGVYVDDSLKVTYWQQSMDDAVSW
ncbi:DUF4232 domain-containing protein [Streptomyces sp. NPDC019531]|uniref:DUF4232 domain-containing protein n=1 Tax=Streptomyces sp. NPDC019531 TaxID=3365062 RepID=UPI00384B4011